MPKWEKRNQRDRIPVHYNFNLSPRLIRPSYCYDQSGERVEAFPSYVYDQREWKEHWEDILGIDEEGRPYTLKDIVYFPKYEDIHPVFLEEMSRQLTAIINVRVGFEVQNFEIMFDVNTKRPIRQNGYCYYYLDLVLPRISSSFWIKWKSLVDKYEYIPMSVPVESDMIRFEIPKRLEIHGRNHPRFDQNHWIQNVRDNLLPYIQRKSTFSFALEVLGRAWPDVRFSLSFRDPLLADGIVELELFISNFINEYNKNSEEQDLNQFIHNVSTVETVDNRTFNFDLDFGSCDPTVVWGFLQKLQECYNRKISCVSIS